MSKKNCIITGSNSGIGKITAIELAKKGYEIAMLVRDSEKSRNAQKEIIEQSKNEDVKLFYVDMASLSSVNQVVEQIKQNYSKIDLLINNAGIFKREKIITADGFEMTIAVNYISLFSLTTQLLPLLENANEARIINLSSALYKRGQIFLDNKFSPQSDKFSGDKAYANSKLLVIYFTKELYRKLKNKSITANCVHPGVVATDVFREYPRWFASMMNAIITKPEKGAEPSIYLATSDDLKNTSGKYFNKLKQETTAEIANDMQLSEKIWDKTVELIS